MRRSLYILLISCVAALGGMMFGFDVAIISGAAPFVQIHFALSELQLGWGVSSLLAGCMLGAAFAGRCADLYGRRRSLWGVALIFALTSLWTALAATFWSFVAARFIGGVAVGAASMISPLYIAESTPKALRGRMVSLNQLAVTGGILVSYGINYLLRDIGSQNWRWMFATGAVPSLFFFTMLFLAPESPRWLLRAGREEEARTVWSRICDADEASAEIEAIQSPSEEAPSTPWRELLSSRHWRVMTVGVLLAVLVQITGVNTIIDYAPIILGSTGVSVDAALFQTFVIGFINFAFTFFAIFTVDKLGRRNLYMIGSAGMTIALVGLSAEFLTGGARGYAALALILLFIASFAACIGPVFWVLMSEIFPGRIRGLAMSVAVFVCWFANFAVVLLFPWLLKNLGGGATFGFLALMSLAMLLLAWKTLPETRGRSLEEIEAHWDNLNRR